MHTLVNEQYFVLSIAFSCNLVCMDFHIILFNYYFSKHEGGSLSFPYLHWNTFIFLRCLIIIQALIDPPLIHRFKALLTRKHFSMLLVYSCLVFEDTGNRPTMQIEPTFKANHAWVSWTKNIGQVKFIPPLRISEEVIAVSIQVSGYCLFYISYLGCSYYKLLLCQGKLKCTSINTWNNIHGIEDNRWSKEQIEKYRYFCRSEDNIKQKIQCLSFIWQW